MPTPSGREDIVRILQALLALIMAMAPAHGQSGVADCGGPDMPCVMDQGEYFALLPDAPAGAPMVVYLHGYGASAASAAGNPDMVAPYTGRGMALILPQGARLNGGNSDWSIDDDWLGGRDWSYPRDDLVFLPSVIADAAERFSLDQDRVLLAGYSRGGSMVWDMACARPDLALGFAAAAGGFWEPMQADCAGPVHLHHTHGFTDPVVPLEGRIFRDQEFSGVSFTARQSDIHAGLAIWREVLDCPPNPNERTVTPDHWTRAWTDCAAGSLTFALHAGGHRVPGWWTDAVLDWFDVLAAADGVPSGAPPGAPSGAPSGD